MNASQSFLGTLIVIALVPPVAMAEQVEFATQIQPVFQQHCGKCHGESKQLGKLQLTSVSGIQAKLASEPRLLVAGKPDESELYQRLVLPANDRKRMPKQADPLPADTIALIRAWIEQGAELEAGPEVEHEARKTSVDAAVADQPLPKVVQAAPEAIARLQAGGAYVVPLYEGSPLLEVSYALRSQPAVDADLDALGSVAEQLFSLNLKGAQATEAGYAALAKFGHLRRLHLELSSITDEGLQHVARLDVLEYLNLYGTQVTDAGLRHLSALQHLRSLYLWQTPVSYEAAMALEEQIGQLDVDLGHDHPVIVQRRLTAEIESLHKQLAEITAEEEAAQRQLDAARQRKETLQARLSERDASLQQLTTSSPDGQSRPADARATDPSR